MAPKNWRIIHRLLEEYRAVNPAPVDTMGCERLSSEQATPVHFSYYWWEGEF